MKDTIAKRSHNNAERPALDGLNLIRKQFVMNKELLTIRSYHPEGCLTAFKGVLPKY